MNKYNNPKEAKVGQKIVDTWYSRSERGDSWGIGIITKVLKTRIHIKYNNANLEKDKRVRVYDLVHYRNFTKIYDRRKKEFKKEDIYA